MQKNNTFLQKHISLSFWRSIFNQDPHLFLMFSEGEVKSPYFSQLWWALLQRHFWKLSRVPAPKSSRQCFCYLFLSNYLHFYLLGKNGSVFGNLFGRNFTIVLNTGYEVNVHETTSYEHLCVCPKPGLRFTSYANAPPPFCVQWWVKGKRHGLNKLAWKFKWQ